MYMHSIHAINSNSTVAYDVAPPTFHWTSGPYPRYLAKLYMTGVCERISYLEVTFLEPALSPLLVKEARPCFGCYRLLRR